MISFPSKDIVAFTSNTMFGYKVGKSFNAFLTSVALDEAFKATKK